MDQVSFFQSAESDAYNAIKPRLLSVLERNWADRSLLALDQRKSYYSITFDGSVVARLKGGKNPYIEFPSNNVDILDGKKRDAYTRISLDDLDKAPDYGNYFEASLQAIIDAIPKEFSCCSRYMECSNRIQCLNPDKDLAMRCGYRKVLMSGKVFYGVNRNIE